MIPLDWTDIPIFSSACRRSPCFCSVCSSFCSQVSDISATSASFSVSFSVSAAPGCCPAPALTNISFSASISARSSRMMRAFGSSLTTACVRILLARSA